MDFSIVIPTWNRSHLLDALLKSLYEERQRFTGGNTEVIVIDSSKDTEKSNIMASCEKYDAIYLEGDDSVRKKRNKGIVASKYDYILFIDSDVVVEKGLLDEYIKGYENNKHVKLGGVLGYTEFVGKKTFWWKILEQTSLINSFSFASDYPFHSWTIGNNVSFKKSVLEEIGMFEENFPFKLGGDDLDMTYRVTKAGYMIGSAPNAITYHSRETWNNFKAIHNRAMRWGTMERIICNRHKELYKRVIPKNYVLILISLIVSAVVSVITNNSLPAISVGLLAVWDLIWAYIKRVKNKGFCNPFYFYCAMGIQGMYEFYRIKQSLKEKSLGAFYCGQVFNRFQIKYGMKDDSIRIWELLLSYTTIFVLVNIVAFIIQRM